MTVSGDKVEQEIVIAAPADFVFKFFTDSARHSLWLGLEAQLDARPGGLYRCVVNDHSIAVGKYVEVLPPERVVFTWGFEGNEALPPGSTTVTVTLRADGPRTILRLVHTGLSRPMLRLHDRGWSGYLPALQAAVAASVP